MHYKIFLYYIGTEERKKKKKIICLLGLITWLDRILSSSWAFGVYGFKEIGFASKREIST